MLRTLGVIQTRSGSGPWCTHASRRLGGQPLLSWVVRRITDSTQLDGVIVLAGDQDQYDRLSKLVPPDVPVVLAAADDTLGQFVRALEIFPAEAVVRLFGDNPFVDPGLIDRLVTAAHAHARCEYATYCSRDGRPAVHSPVGIFAEWIRTRSLRRAARLARDPADRQHVTRYLYSHPEKFPLRLIPAPGAIDRDDVRLTVESDEDWDHALAIYEALGPESLDWQRIATLLDHQPALRSRMAALNRAGAGV
jgi:spore coat polysaccharide biosynthesis protein SpsF